jgi:L-alanine-DL-glutamate epimerase-like enolase superfamily enzyme
MANSHGGAGSGPKTSATSIQTISPSVKWRRPAPARIVLPMRVRLRDVGLGVSDCTTRLPFRFGMNTMTWAPTLTARVELETEAGPAVGYSADLLVPKWFEKDPEKSLRQDVEGLMNSARAAGKAAKAQPEMSVFDLWWRVYRERVHSRPVDASDRLLRGFGVALVERAIIDAACRAADVSFFDALKGDLFQLDPGEVYPELKEWSLAESLPARPLDRVALRHTIGLVDSLRSQDLGSDGRVDDGLPESLEEDIRRYGLRWFKLKLCGDAAVDLPRTARFAEVVAENAGSDVRITVDGNEQFADLDLLVKFMHGLDQIDGGSQLLEQLVCIEQPLPRAASFEESNRAGLAALAEIAPVILDEADHGVEALPRALELGYRGVSMKNCKGVLRAMLQRGLCERHDAFQSAEDLTNLGVLAQQQDLATVAALGLTHVERNGHHYFRGLDHLSADEGRSAAALHPDLWNHCEGETSLRIEEGELQLDSLQCVGYGYSSEIDWGSRTTLDSWEFPEG